MITCKVKINKYKKRNIRLSQRLTVKVTVVGPIPTQINEFFRFLRSGNWTKHSVEFRYSTLNVSNSCGSEELNVSAITQVLFVYLAIRKKLEIR